ncbi:hypothetical protein P3T73_10770 [Kiritimatiellota bacterium B12222]|nr:hypothetical protein P3T73_10770 [Kiritimatiellota bacterium B12222]
MKKLLLPLCIVALSSSLYAGSACCSTAKKEAPATEKKSCDSCEKAEGKCDTCKAKPAADAKK